MESILIQISLDKDVIQYVKDNATEKLKKIEADRDYYNHPDIQNVLREAWKVEAKNILSKLIEEAIWK